MINYIYLKVDECWLTSMPKQRFKFQFSLTYVVISENVVSERDVVAINAVEVN